MEILFVTLLGLAFGSFVNALVWRLHKKRDFVTERSECTHCHHILAWYDLIPVLSWLSLKGKCRYCRKRIEDSPLTELSVAAVFGLSYAFWPLGLSVAGIVLLIVWLTAAVLLAALFLYDLRWMLLPNKLVYPLIALGVVWFVFNYLAFTPIVPSQMVLDLALGLGSVAGLYGFLYFVSKGEWVGLGDVKLGVFMGLVLGWERGLLAVVLANLIAFMFVLPGLLTGKIKRTARIPFGPFLILATVITFLLGYQLLRWYFSATLSFI